MAWDDVDESDVEAVPEEQCSICHGDLAEAAGVNRICGECSDELEMMTGSDPADWDMCGSSTWGLVLLVVALVVALAALGLARPWWSFAVPWAFALVWMGLGVSLIGRAMRLPPPLELELYCCLCGRRECGRGCAHRSCADHEVVRYRELVESEQEELAGYSPAQLDAFCATFCGSPFTAPGEHDPGCVEAGGGPCE